LQCHEKQHSQGLHWDRWLFLVAALATRRPEIEVMQRMRRHGTGVQNYSKSFTKVDKLGEPSHGSLRLSTEVNYNRADMPKSLQLLLRDARNAIEAAVRADLAQNGFGDVAPAHSALLRNVGDDGARPSELAAHADVTRQAITKLVDELERLDLVRRDPDPDDGRGVIIRYTERGRAGVAIARKRMRELERGYAARVGADRWAEVRSTLETLFGDDPHEDLSLSAAADLSNRERPDHNQARATGE
jgi:DNA-binding MarR family transcriptional regulator